MVEIYIFQILSLSTKATLCELGREVLFGTKSKHPKIRESGLGVISGVNLASSRHVSRPQHPWLSLRDPDYVIARALWEPVITPPVTPSFNVPESVDITSGVWVMKSHWGFLLCHPFSLLWTTHSGRGQVPCDEPPFRET